MLIPTSELTAKIYLPIELADTDRLAISLNEHKNFVTNIYGVRLSEAQYRDPKISVKERSRYSCHYLSKDEGYIYFALPSYAARHDFIERIPERKRLSDKDNYRGERWELAGTDITVSLLYNFWIKPFDIINDSEDSREVFDLENFSRIAFADETAKMYFKYLLAVSARSSANAKIISQYKSAKKEYEEAKASGLYNGQLVEYERKVQDTLPEASGELQFCAEKPLAVYQQLALYLQNVNDGFGSFMEQGTGKTPPSIANIDNLALQKYEESRAKGENKIFKALVICPNNVRSNWEKEFQNFSTVEGRVTIVRGTEKNRIKCFVESLLDIRDEKYTALICGYDIIARFPALFEFIKFPDGDTLWDAIYCDESHFFKDCRTKRWEKGIIKLRDRAKRRYPLTGTPICNNINDLWTQLEFIREGGSGFKSFKNFQDFYSQYDENMRTVGYQNLPFIQERLARMSFFISKKEALPDLPEKVYDIREVEMSSKQILVYEKIATELQYKIDAELAASDGKPDAMTVNNILTQLLRLAQITSGFITYDAVYDNGVEIRPKRIERFKEQPKINAVLELLKERQQFEKTLIWACFESDILALQQAVEDAGYKYVMFYGKTSENERKEAEYLFNHNDEYTVFIGNAAAGGTGLNLLGYPPQHPELSESNVTQEIFYSQNWSAVQRSQAEDRAHRRGTRTNVRIIDLQVAQTIDDEIRKRVVDKRQSAYEISDLTDVLQNVLHGVNIFQEN